MWVYKFSLSGKLNWFFEMIFFVLKDNLLFTVKDKLSKILYFLKVWFGKGRMKKDIRPIPVKAGFPGAKEKTQQKGSAATH